MSEPIRRLNLALPESTYQALAAHATGRGLTFSAAIRRAISAYLHDDGKVWPGERRRKQTKTKEGE